MNPFQGLLQRKFGFTEAYEFALVTQLEKILGPATPEKAGKIMQALMTEDNYLIERMVIREGESAVLTYCKKMGYFGGLMELLLRAANIAKDM